MSDDKQTDIPKDNTSCDCSDLNIVCTEDDLDRTILERISGTLYKSDVSLLAVALSMISIPNAIAIINDAWQSTEIDLTDPKLADFLSSHPEAVDHLQSYESTIRTHLLSLIRKVHQERAVNDQSSVVRVRYNKFRMWYGGGITTFACAYMLFITYQNLSYADTVLGFLMGTMVSTIVSFYFGSSAKQGDLAENDVFREKYNHTSTPSSTDNSHIKNEHHH